MWSDIVKPSRAPYKAEPEKNVPLTEEQAAKMKRRVTEARRAIEDREIDKQLEIE